MNKQEYKQLQELAANGGMKYFGQLYETIYREMYYTAFYSLADDTDAVEIVTNVIKSGFSSIGRLHTENAFRVFMMKKLCASILAKLKEYPADKNKLQSEFSDTNEFDVKYELSLLPDMERLVCVLYVGGKFRTEEIAQFTGLSHGTVKKKLKYALAVFELY